MRRKLPLFVERSLQQILVDRTELADKFERTLLGYQVVSCKAGCTSCCHHPVFISVLEAIPLYESLVEHGYWTPSFKEKLRKISNLTGGLSFEVWLFSKIPCVLLSDKNLCMAYEVRPFVCRATIATGDPTYCDAQRLSETTIVPRKEIVHEYHTREKTILRKHGLFHLTMPVGRAILLAERVVTGTLLLENTDRAYVSENLES